MSKLSEIVNGAVSSLIGTRNHAKTGLAITTGGGAATFKSGALTFSVNGVYYSANALTAQSMAIAAGNGPFSGAGFVQPASTTVYYSVGIKADGTVLVVQGSYAGQTFNPAANVGIGAKVGTSIAGDGSVPDLPDGYAPLGVIKIVTDSSHTFTPGTTNLDAAGVTTTYFDVTVLPSGAL